MNHRVMQKMPYGPEDLEALAAPYAHLITKMNTSLHVAALYGRGKTLLGLATNRAGSRSSGAGFSNQTIHAERAVMKAVGDVSLLKGATLVVVRVTKEGKTAGSAPCKECQAAIEAAMRKYGLKRVVHS
jgi:hypothetical protein